MNRSFTLLLPLLFHAPAMGQPMLQATEHMPVPGTTRVIYRQVANGLEIPTGEALTWDFTWLSMQETKTANYQAVVNPEWLAVGATLFVGTYVPGLTTGIFGVDTGGLNDFDPSSYWVSCSEGEVTDNLKLLPSTLSYGDSLLDYFGSSCETQYDGQYESGLHTVRCVGWGTLTMPWGTVENVLQVTSLKETMYLELPGGYDTFYRSTGVRFYHPGAVEPVVAVEYEYYHSGSSWVELSSGIYFIVEVGLGLPEALDGRCTVWPNPSTSQVNVSLKAPIPSGARFEVLDQAGRIVLHGPLTAQSGNPFGAQLELGMLPSGSYILHLNHPKGTLGTARLMKE